MEPSRKQWKVSPSKLETFRKFINGLYNNYITQESFIKTVKREAEWTPQATIGSAYHAVIELGSEPFRTDQKGLYYVKVDDMPEGVYFTADQLTHALKFRERYQGMSFETWSRYYTDYRGQPVQVLMRLDGIYGLEVHEQKTTRGYYDFKSYYDSTQWRFYLLASGGHRVQYNVFQALDADTRDIRQSRDIRFEYDHFSLYPYPGMKHDIDRWLLHYFDACQDLGLTEYVYK